MTGPEVVVTLIFGGIIGLAIYRVRKWQQAAEIRGARETAARILDQARMKSEVIRKGGEAEARDIVLGSKKEAEQESRERRRELQLIEQRLHGRDEALEKRQALLAKREEEVGRTERRLGGREEALDRRDAETGELREAMQTRLEEVAVLTREEAKRDLLNALVEEARHESAKEIRQIEEEAREEAERKAKRIISIAIERFAGEFVAERTVTTVPLPLRRPEGPNHRPGGAEHPGDRRCDRRRFDHR